MNLSESDAIPRDAPGDKAEHDVEAETEGWRTTLREEVVALHQKGQEGQVIT